MNAIAEPLLGWELLLTLAIGGTAIVAFAAAACGLRRSPVVRRQVWQSAILGLLLLLALELTGMGGSLIQLAYPVISIATGEASIHEGAQLAESKARQAFSRELSASPMIESVPLSGAITGIEHRTTATTSVAAISSTSKLMDTSPTRKLGTIDGLGIPARAGLWCGIVWVAGVFLVGLRVAGGHLLLLLFRWRHGNVENHVLRDQVQLISRRLSWRQRVQLVEAAGLSSPIAFGVWRPVIGLPVGFVEEFSADEQQAMLAHELAHLAGRDPVWHLLADVAAACFWWHPLVWWSRNQLQATSEVVADEASQLLDNGPETLAACLVRLARRVNRRPIPAWLGIRGSGFRSSLGQRVMRLLNLTAGEFESERQVRRGLFLVLGPAALVAAALVTTAWAHAQPFQKGESTMNMFTNSWRRSLAGVVVLAAVGPTTSVSGQEARRDQDRPAAERREGDRPAAPREGGPDAARRPEAGRDAAQPAPERRQMEAQMAELQRALARASEAGQRDAQRKLEAEILNLKVRLETFARQQPDRPAADGRRPDGAPRDGERRPDGAPRDGERRPEGAPRDGDRRPEGAPRDGERRPEGAPRDGDRRPDAGPRDGDRRPDGAPEPRRPGVGPQGRPLDDGRAPEGRGQPGIRGPGPGPEMAEMMRAMQELRAEIQRLRAEVGELRAKVQQGPGGGERGERPPR